MKSCPFCRSGCQSTRLTIGFWHVDWHVECRCGARGPIAKSRAKAAKNWDARPEVTYCGDHTSVCAVCLNYKYTPLNISEIGGNICINCITNELLKPEPLLNAPALVGVKNFYTGIRQSDVVQAAQDEYQNKYNRD